MPLKMKVDWHKCVFCEGQNIYRAPQTCFYICHDCGGMFDPPSLSVIQEVICRREQIRRQLGFWHKLRVWFWGRDPLAIMRELQWGKK